MSFWQEIEQKISSIIGRPFELENRSVMSGGSINQAFQIHGKTVVAGKSEVLHFFIKTNHESYVDMFEAEAAGLAEIQKTQSITVPKVFCSGVVAKQSYIVMEALSISQSNADSAALLGKQLAQMHQYKKDHFGWYRDNTIGTTQQLNAQVKASTENWIEFWREQRLGYQLVLAKQNGANASLLNKGYELQNQLALFFKGYTVEASILHGDLWSGNYAYLKGGEPVIYDPAVYYGDRETDIAMTELFGGFSAGFYQAYNQAWPLDKGYQQRKPLYNLYHVLNHFNLFGGGYAMQAESMMDNLIR